MTPKEKAQELLNKYVALTDNWVYGIHDWKHKKQCALIAVDEILKLVSNDLDLYYKDCIYWEQVKAEIESP